jgi:hypothetical protein
VELRGGFGHAAGVGDAGDEPQVADFELHGADRSI